MIPFLRAFVEASFGCLAVTASVLGLVHALFLDLSYYDARLFKFMVLFYCCVSFRRPGLVKCLFSGIGFCFETSPRVDSYSCFTKIIDLGVLHEFIGS